MRVELLLLLTILPFVLMAKAMAVEVVIMDYSEIDYSAINVYYLEEPEQYYEEPTDEEPESDNTFYYIFPTSGMCD